jgi:hypothetical protein
MEEFIQTNNKQVLEMIMDNHGENVVFCDRLVFLSN